MSEIRKLYTLNARNNILLEVIHDYFKLESEGMSNTILGMHVQTINALRKKQISYDELKPALVPSHKRQEIALVFDTIDIDSSFYGFDVMKRVIPLFRTESNHSVLEGDYLALDGQEHKLIMALKETVKFRHHVEIQHPSQFFIVYINNLTDAMVKRFDNGLREYRPYVGFANMTYRSMFKVFLSNMLVNAFVKHGNIILQGHESDLSSEENVNIRGYPFEENGYVCRSINDDIFGVFLSYKIERPVYEGFKVDTVFALNSISSTPIELEEFEIEVSDDKLEYLKREKTNSINRAGLLSIKPEQLASMIRAKISDNYIYNMSYNITHNVMKFNIILEFQSTNGSSKTRLLAALEYQPDHKKLRLITLY